MIVIQATGETPMAPFTLSLPGRRRQWIFLLLASIASSAASAGICYLCCGNSLNLFLAGVFIAPLLVAPLSAIAGRLSGVVAISLGMVIGLQSVWLISVSFHLITISRLAQADSIVLALSLAIGGLTSGLRTLRLPLSAASATTCLTALAWLTLPIWISIPFAGRQVSWLSSVHPLFAMNHAVFSESMPGIWTEQQGAYGLTNFGQDVQYQMPSSIWPCVLFHGAIALAAFATAFRPAGSLRRS